MPGQLADLLAQLTATTVEGIASTLDDLSDSELHALPFATGTPIGVQAWHVFRSVDNVVHFAFYREPTLWLQQGLDAAWGFPRNEQGTGMPLETTQAMRFPSAAALAAYGRAVGAAARTRIAAMDDEFLAGTTPARVMGQVTERRRADTISAVLIAHGNQHLGQIQVLRQLLGKPDEGP